MKTQQNRLYTLADPYTFEVRFVGCSSKAIQQLGCKDPRFVEAAKPGSLGEWLDSLDQPPVVAVVKGVTKTNWRQELIDLTKKLKAGGANLIHNNWADPSYKRERPSRETKPSELEQLQAQLAELQATVAKIEKAMSHA